MRRTIVQLYNEKEFSRTKTPETNSEQFTDGTSEVMTTPFVVETEPSKDVATVSVDQYSTTESITTIRTISTKTSTDTTSNPLSTKASTDKYSSASFTSTEQTSLFESIPTKTSIPNEQPKDTTIKSVTDLSDITTNVMLVDSRKSTRIHASLTDTSTLTTESSSHSLQHTTRIMNDVSRNDTPSLNTIGKFNLVLIVVIVSSLLFVDSCSGICSNSSTWNTDICACDCLSGSYGNLCNSDCSTQCNNGAAVNESTCDCICNEKQTGSKCDCLYPFTGGYCDTCAFDTCENGGIFNATSCSCTCLDDNEDPQCKVEQSTSTVSTVSSTAFSNGSSSSKYNDDIDITFIIIIVCVGVTGIGIVIICWCFIVIICKKKKCRVSNGCCVCCVVSDKCCFCCVVRNRCCVFSNKCSDKAVFTKVIPFKR